MLASLGAILAFLASLLAIAATVPFLLTLLYGWNHPEDGSAGDSAGWALIILSPVLVPVALLIAAAGAFAIFVAIDRAGKLGPAPRRAPGGTPRGD